RDPRAPRTSARSRLRDRLTKLRCGASSPRSSEQPPPAAPARVKYAEAPPLHPHSLQTIRPLIRADSLKLRRLALLGARHGPDWWLRYSPPWFGYAFAALLPEQRRRLRANFEQLGVGG